MGPIERPSAVRFTEAPNRNSQFLLEISAALSMWLPPRPLVEHFARISVGFFCDVCAVYLTDHDGSLRRSALAAADEPLRAKADGPLAAMSSSAQGFIRDVMRSGKTLRLGADAAVDSFVAESAASVLQATGMLSTIALPLFIGSEPVGAVCFLKADDSGPYRDVDVGYARAVGQQLILALENARVREREQRAEARSALLRDATDRFFSTSDEHQMLVELINAIVQEFADRAVVIVLTENRLQPIASAGTGLAENGHLFHESDERTFIQAIQEQRPILANIMYSDAWMMSPLFIAGRAYGAVLCYSTARRYDSEDLKTLQELCQRTSLALEYANNFARERRLAQTLQRAALPPNLAEIPGAIKSVVYRPASEEEQVGGDWYDLFSLGGDRILVTIGDVTGHGLQAWSLMTKLRHTINVIAKYDENPVGILDAVEPIVQQRYPDAIATAFVAIIDTRRRTIAYANAGHPAPMMRRKGAQICRLSAQGLPVGLRSLESGSRKFSTIELKDVELLVFYTDGLTESTRNIIDGERWLMYALKSDAAVVTSDSADFIKSTCLHGPLPDDVAVLALNFVEMDRWRFASDDASAAQASRRDFCDRLRQKWERSEDSAVAEIIFGELVSNVVRHAPGLVELALEWRGERAILHVLDRGEGYQPVSTTRADVLSEGGRGLWLIDKLGGELEFEPLPGFGMHTRVVLPHV